MRQNRKNIGYVAQKTREKEVLSALFVKSELCRLLTNFFNVSIIK